MPLDTIHHVDVAIIGAGWYGLVAARTYLRLRPAAQVLIIDSDSTVGGVWSKERLYPNLVAQVKLGLFNYSDTPMPPNGGNAEDPRVTGEMIHSYLHKYAQDHDLLRRIRFNSFVTSASQTPQGRWRLSLRDSVDIIDSEKLLIATGVTSIPYLPPFDEGHDDSALVIHSRDLGASFEALHADDEDDNVREVVVVGAAKSAYDAVYLLLTMGKRVTWAIRPGGAGPLAILPFNILGTVNSIAMASTRLMTHLSPSILNVRGPLYWLMQRTPVGRWSVGKFWDCLDYISGRHAGYWSGDHVEKLTPEIERQSVFWAHSGLGVVTLPDFWSTLHSTNLTIVRDTVRMVRDRTAFFKSGASTRADALIMCTGWGDHFAMFDDHDKAKLGIPAYYSRPGELPPLSSLAGVGKEKSPISHVPPEEGIDWERYDAAAESSVNEQLPFLASTPILGPKANSEYKPTGDIDNKAQSLLSLDSRLQRKWRLYRRAIPVAAAERGDRSIAILGQIHTVQTPLVAEVQSLWAILYLLGDLDLPETHEMATEIALWNAWTRKRYLNQGQKFPYSLYDFLPYIDVLFRDLGLESRRKPNFVSETFSPYYPSDFYGFLDEYLEMHEAKNGEKQV